MLEVNNDVHPIYVTRDHTADVAFSAGSKMPPPGYVSPANPLPAFFDVPSFRWFFDSEKTTQFAVLTSSWQERLSTVAVTGLVACGVGFWLGRDYESRRKKFVGDGVY